MLESETGERLKFRKPLFTEVSPNYEADLLEKHLGITIPVEPLKIVLNDSNIIRLAFNPRFRRALKYNHSYWGMYIFDYNSVVIKVGLGESHITPIEVGLHENAHAYYEQMQFLFKGNYKIPMSEARVPLVSPARYYKLFEDIPMWMGAEALARNKGISQIGDLRRFHDDYADDYAKNRRDNWGEHNEGYAVARAIMEALRDLGLPINKALDLVIKTPPVNSDDTHDLKQYLSRIDPQIRQALQAE